MVEEKEFIFQNFIGEGSHGIVYRYDGQDESKIAAKVAKF